MRTPRQIKLESVKEFPLPVEKLWNLLTHTRRLHEMGGQSNVTYEPYTGGLHILFQKASTRTWLGRQTFWKEYLNEWVRHQSFNVYREFKRGFFIFCNRGIELEPTARGTKVRVYVELTPKWSWVRPLAMMKGKLWIRDVHHYCDQFHALWVQRGRYIYPCLVGGGIRNFKWSRHLAQFDSPSPETEKLVEKLKQHLMESYGDELLGMRPKALADQWGVERNSVIQLCLFAAKEGMLVLNWMVSCPVCRTPKLQLSTFSEIPSRCYCDFCQKPFRVDLDNVELRFSVNPLIRSSMAHIRSQEGPAYTSHIWVQHFIAPGSVWKFPIEMGEEKFRCRTLRTNISCELVPTVKHSSQPTDIRLIFNREGWMVQTVLFRPGRQEIEIVNDSHTPIVIALEKTRGDKQSLTATEVTSLQEFHYLFPKELPYPGRRFSIGRLSLLLVDIRNSTEFYSRIGDRQALDKVQYYLLWMSKLVQENLGAVAKINGDSLLAVFSEADRGLRTAFQVQQQIRSFNQTHKIVPSLELRVGLHRGPALGIFRQGKLDYFGKAVNHVFRIQQYGKGDDIILSQSFFQDELIQQVLKDYLFDHEMREVSEETDIYSFCQLMPVFKERKSKKRSASTSRK